MWTLKAINDWRMRLALLRLRESAAALGYPLDDLTDDQIRRGLRHLGNVVRMSGHSVEDTATAMETFGLAWNDHLTKG